MKEGFVSYEMTPIAVARSCFKQKFGVPRQPGLVREAMGVIEFYPEYGRAEAFNGLEKFSHIWLVYVFHQTREQGWRPTVRPPRLGGNMRRGVYATRSPFRPNAIGLSVVELEDIELGGGLCRLNVRGLDLVDGTPILDVKPYLNYVDAIPDARSGFAAQRPSSTFTVVFTDVAREQCSRIASIYPNIRVLIEQILALDPRPAYVGEQDEAKVYGMKLYDYDLRWRVRDEIVIVEALAEC